MSFYPSVFQYAFKYASLTGKNFPNSTLAIIILRSNSNFLIPCNTPYSNVTVSKITVGWCKFEFK